VEKGGGVKNRRSGKHSRGEKPISETYIGPAKGEFRWVEKGWGKEGVRNTG